jgi:outer membrane protein OmpA-like peptidoglycan-associated protein
MMLLLLAFIMSGQAFARETCDVDQPISIAELREVLDSCFIPVGTLISIRTEEVDTQPQKPGIGFKSNDSELNQNGKDVLDGVASLMLIRSKLRINVVGYADSHESGDLLDLSYRRAEVATKYLIGKGVQPERIQTVAGGVEVIIDTTGTYEGQARNRRVEFVISTSEPVK